MCFWNVLDFTQNMELLCVAGCCCLPFAGSHWHWKDDRIFIAGLAEAARRGGLAESRFLADLESLGCMEKFVHNLQ
jgi:hypothetical protein